MDYLSALLLPLLLIVLWLFYLLPNPTTPLSNESITLLIAHPDDEAMFFSPALLALSQPRLNNSINVLCLSSGDADGLGAVRKKELVASCRQLGITQDSAVAIIEDDELPDSMSTTWPASKVSHYLKQQPTPSMILTFDSSGVSSHPNHISLLHGARSYVRSNEGTKLYILTTVPLWRKYISVLDAPLTMLLSKGRKIFVSSPKQVRTAQSAMTTAHKSQMRWFRWGWIGMSRYMVINDLTLDKE